MEDDSFTLQQVLTIARRHPFYNHEIEYPLSPTEVAQILRQEEDRSAPSLRDFGVVTKKELSDVISRLLADDSPQNSYRHHSYTTVTGGGFKRSAPLLWLTDSLENRRHRAEAGDLLNVTGVIEPTDLVVNIHVAGHFYRSLDLTTDYMEHAGATVLPAGSDMSPGMVTDALIQYRATCLSGPVTELLKVALHIDSLADDMRGQIRVNKLYYTSEPITPAQSTFLHNIFGAVDIYSGLGSAEIGFWGVSNEHLTGPQEVENAINYIYDTRKMVVEILSTETEGEAVPDGEVGFITVTSLQRPRNPLVRYNSGDLGSLHPLPAAARSHFPPETADFYRVIRMYGRDPRFSFTWNSHTFDYPAISRMMQRPGWNILHWQIIINSRPEGEPLTIHILRNMQEGGVSNTELDEELVAAFHATENPLFYTAFLRDLSGFERSATGRKVIRFVDIRDPATDTDNVSASAQI